MHMKRSQVASLGIPTGPFFPLTSMYRAATQLFVPQTLGQHFSKVSHSCGERTQPSHYWGQSKVLFRDPTSREPRNFQGVSSGDLVCHRYLWSETQYPRVMSRNMPPAPPEWFLNTLRVLSASREDFLGRKMNVCFLNTNLIIILSYSHMDCSTTEPTTPLLHSPKCLRTRPEKQKRMESLIIWL